MPAEDKIAAEISRRLRARGIALTLGGEPTYVPVDPTGAEWNFTAVGPTKLTYAYALADTLIADSLPGAAVFFSPGKLYPGETNPRWALNILWRKDGKRLLPARKANAKKPALADIERALLGALRLDIRWLRATDPTGRASEVRVLPLDHAGRRWVSARWGNRRTLELSGAEGPAGLRLPLSTVPDGVSRRALVLEVRDQKLHVFLPPLRQRPFTQLLRAIEKAIAGPHYLEGYVPEDEKNLWHRAGLTADPGVLEINLPACATWQEYRGWLTLLERTTATIGLRSHKQTSAEESAGTGGGNHLLFGGPTLEKTPFFTEPGWLVSILRYWQRHPALSYLFTGVYVGASSQAPRPDESARDLPDLEMAYRFLEKLPAGDHRGLLSETLRHLHIDGSGNTHRSEISFDKFWNASWPGGCRGLIEFRAVESLPHADWMSAVALLWMSLATMLLEKPCRTPLVAHGRALHDRYFLPTPLWLDFSEILADLRRARLGLDESIFRAIWDWRFPLALEHGEKSETLTIRRAHEEWPLLCETPLEGGSTSRFVDSSMARLEFRASPAFAENIRLFINSRELPLLELAPGIPGAALRFRRTQLHPALHPGIAPQVPLIVTIARGDTKTSYRLEADRRLFVPHEGKTPRLNKRPCQLPSPGTLTYDLRLP